MELIRQCRSELDRTTSLQLRDPLEARPDPTDCLQPGQLRLHNVDEPAASSRDATHETSGGCRTVHRSRRLRPHRPHSRVLATRFDAVRNSCHADLPS